MERFENGRDHLDEFRAEIGGRQHLGHVVRSERTVALERSVGSSPYSLMSEEVFDGIEDEAHMKSFLDSLEGEIHVEEWVYLPLAVGGERVTIAGIVDLMHVVDGRVEVIDYKTDRWRNAECEYRTQLSVYYHVL